VKPLLLVEDDADLRRTLHQSLRLAGYAVDVAGDGYAAEAALAGRDYMLMVLDLGLPQLDGLDVLRRLRERRSTLPVLVLTARDGVEQRVRGLRLGADDYLAKPFALQELEARLEALARRAAGGYQPLVNGPLQLDLGQGALLGGVPLDLPQRELSVLEALMQRPGQVVQKSRLSQKLGDRNGALGSNAVEVYVHRLRRKLEPAGIVIRTIHGVGYALEPFGGS
jgi:DNA-binding response OmpR family regulator